MSIVIDENLIGVWYAQTGEMQDYLMAVNRCPEGLSIVYRLRQYASLDPWDEKDTSKWRRMVTADKDEDKAIDTVREMMQAILQLSLNMKMIEPPGMIYELIRGANTPEEFAKILQAMPFAHTKTETVQ